MKGYETRVLHKPLELRKDEEGSVHIEGLGIVFNELSEDLGGFQERILPEAMDGVDLSDVYSFINHDPNLVMGRTKSGTMEVEVRSDGVHYRVRPPKSALTYIENIERGDIDGSSFSFRIAQGGDSWEERDGGQVPLRTIKKFSAIKEIGAVVGPAYTQTSSDIALRNLQEWKKTQEVPEEGMDEATKMKADLLKVKSKENKF